MAAMIPVQDLRRQLETQGLAVWEGAMSEELVQKWRTSVLEPGDSRRSFIENGQAPSIRSDVVRFVSCRDTMDDDDDPAAQVAREGLDLLEHVVVSVTDGRTLGTQTPLDLWRPDQGMMARYLRARAAHYTWHHDNEQTEAGRWRNYRTLTAILYLNPVDWNVDRDGGGLECEIPSSSSSPTTQIISPKGGTLVLFDSRTIRHRVLPAHRDRLALTQWFVSPQLAANDAHAPVGPRRLRMDRKRKDPPTNGKISSAQQSSNDTTQDGNFCHLYAKQEHTANVKAPDSFGQKASEEATAKGGFRFGFF